MTRYCSSLTLFVVVGFTYAATQAVFPPAGPPYTSSFIQPQPPNITAEFRANYMQHKYDVDVNHNHIISGFMYMSPNHQKLRLEADNGQLQASLFDFSNTTVGGLVSNVVFSFFGGLANATCSSFFVPPFLPALSPDILGVRNAVYTGVQIDELHGAVSTWMFTFTDVTATLFLDPHNTLVRYDFVSPGPLRTYATTRFFNIISRPIDVTLFETNCH